MLNLSSLSIRHAQHSDLNICLQFETEDHSVHPNHDERLACLTSRIQTQDIILAFDQNIPIAYMRLDKLWPMQKPIISWIFVSPSHRGRNILSNLYQFLLNHLKLRGYKQLLCSAQSNRPHIIRWMKKHGMYECGCLKKINDGTDIDEIFFAIDL